MKDQDLEQQRKYVLLLTLLIICFSVFALLIGLFIYLKILALWIFNIINCCIMLFNYFLIKRKRFLSALQITVLVIIVHCMFAAYCLGWNSNFGLSLLTSGIIIVNSLFL